MMPKSSASGRPIRMAKPVFSIHFVPSDPLSPHYVNYNDPEGRFRSLFALELALASLHNADRADFFCISQRCNGSAQNLDVEGV